MFVGGTRYACPGRCSSSTGLAPDGAPDEAHAGLLLAPDLLAVAVHAGHHRVLRRPGRAAQVRPQKDHSDLMCWITDHGTRKPPVATSGSTTAEQGYTNGIWRAEGNLMAHIRNSRR